MTPCGAAPGCALDLARRPRGTRWGGRPAGSREGWGEFKRAARMMQRDKGWGQGMRARVVADGGGGCQGGMPTAARTPTDAYARSPSSTPPSRAGLQDVVAHARCLLRTRMRRHILKPGPAGSGSVGDADDDAGRCCQLLLAAEGLVRACVACVRAVCASAGVRRRRCSRRGESAARAAAANSWLCHKATVCMRAGKVGTDPQVIRTPPCEPPPLDLLSTQTPPSPTHDYDKPFGGSAPRTLNTRLPPRPPNTHAQCTHKHTNNRPRSLQPQHARSSRPPCCSVVLGGSPSSSSRSKACCFPKVRRDSLNLSPAPGRGAPPFRSPEAGCRALGAVALPPLLPCLLVDGRMRSDRHREQAGGRRRGGTRPGAGA